MCLILFAWQSHPEYRLVLLANRDEFHLRPSAAAAPWPQRPPLLAGRDLQAGGTWLGLGARGRIAAVTNVRRADAAIGSRSRGELPAEFLLSDTGAEDYVSTCLSQGSVYSGFNLLAADAQRLVYGNNIDGSGASALPPGVYGLSNAALDTPWPKLEGARQELADWLGHGSSTRELLDILLDERRPPDERLPDTGIGREQERLLSSRFIRSDVYGTRACSIVLVRHNGDAHFHEWRFGPAGHPAGSRHFHWPAGGDVTPCGIPRPVQPGARPLR